MGEAKRNRMDAGYTPPARWKITRRIAALRTVTEDDLKLLPLHDGMLHCGDTMLLHEMAELEIDGHALYIAITHGVPTPEQIRTMISEDLPGIPVEVPALGATLNCIGQFKLLALLSLQPQGSRAAVLLQHVRVGGAARPLAFKLHKFLRRAPANSIIILVTDDVDAVAGALGWLDSTAPVTEVRLGEQEDK